MLKMIKFEFRKLRKSKAFYICAVLVVFMAIASLFAEKKILVDMFESDIDLGVGQCMCSALSSAMLFTIASIFTAIFVADDFQNGTIKNIYSRGFGRDTTLFAKYIVNTVAIFIFAMLAYISTFIYSLTLSDDTEITGKLLGLLAMQLLFALIMNTFYFFVSIMTGKIGFAIAINIVGPSMIATALNLLTFVFDLDFSVADYWISKVADSLNLESTGKEMGKATLIMLIYEVVLLFLSCRINKQKEIS